MPSHNGGVSRADLVVDLTLVVNLLAPAVAFASLRLARGRRHDLHRKVQLALLAVCLLAFVALEVRIRVAGGSGALLAGAPAHLMGLARVALGVHISVAVATYVGWIWLAIASSRRYKATLPGRFSRVHGRAGRWIFGGLCFNAASATLMYLLAFVA